MVLEGDVGPVLLRFDQLADGTLEPVWEEPDAPPSRNVGLSQNRDPFCMPEGQRERERETCIYIYICTCICTYKSLKEPSPQEAIIWRSGNFSK